MALFSTIRDLFAEGAVAIAEQFIRGTSSYRSFVDLMTGRYGDEYNVPKPDEENFVSLVSLAGVAGQKIQQGSTPDESTIQPWIGWPKQGEFIHTGLARLSVVNSAGQEEFATHMPFSEIDEEILKYSEILNRIDKALETDILQGFEWYSQDIDRIEQYLTLLEIKGGFRRIEAELYSVFEGEL